MFMHILRNEPESINPTLPKKIILLLVSYTVKTVHSKHAIKRTPVHSGHIFRNRPNYS